MTQLQTIPQPAFGNHLPKNGANQSTSPGIWSELENEWNELFETAPGIEMNALAMQSPNNHNEMPNDSLLGSYSPEPPPKSISPKQVTLPWGYDTIQSTSTPKIEDEKLPPKKKRAKGNKHKKNQSVKVDTALQAKPSPSRAEKIRTAPRKPTHEGKKKPLPAWVLPVAVLFGLLITTVLAIVAYQAKSH